MENSTKQKITVACQENTTIVIKQPDFFLGSPDIYYSYEVTNDRDVERTLYSLVNIRCDGFGCTYPSMEVSNIETLGNCNDLSFLD